MGAAPPDDRDQFPDVGPRLIADGGQISAGSPWANRAADIGSRLVHGMVQGTAELLAEPGRQLEPNPYPPGSEDEAWFENKRQDRAAQLALALAMMVMGGGAAGAPVRAGEAMFSAGPVRKLPMDLASRMARAKAMVFHTDMPLNHGTGVTFDEFKAVPTRGVGLQSPGVASARDPEVANKFAENAAARAGFEGPSLGGRNEFADNVLASHPDMTAPQVCKVFHRGDSPARLTLRGSESRHQVAATLQDAFDAGHDAVMIRNHTSPGGKTGDIIIVKNANQLRSPNAAFDPAKRESAYLFASGPIGPAGAALLATAPSAHQQQTRAPFALVPPPR